MNLDTLLAPVPGPSPCGEDMTFSPEFDQIAELRREDDPTLDQGEWVTALKVADWPGVVNATRQLLNERTKDLRLAMWLTEGLMLTRGLPGLALGLQTCQQLTDRYWADLHPQADDGDQAQRAGNVAWLLQRMVQLLPTLPMTRGRQGGRHDLRAWQQAQRPPAGGNEPPGNDRLTVEQFMRALRDTPRDWLAEQLTGAREAQACLLAWQHLIDQHLGADGPSFVPAKEALATWLDEFERLARDMGVGTDPAAASAVESQPSPATAGDAVGATPSAWDLAAPGACARGPVPVQSRAQALQQLREVSAFFKRTEPHSPVAYLADKAVAWAEMPLHEWLRRVVKDQGSMAHLQELLGIEPEAPPPY